MNFREEGVKSYVKVPSLSGKYETCRNILLRTSATSLYVPSLFLNDSALTERVYRVARAGRCVMVIMVFFQSPNPPGNSTEMGPVRHDQRMLGSV